MGAWLSPPHLRALVRSRLAPIQRATVKEQAVNLSASRPSTDDLPVPHDDGGESPPRDAPGVPGRPPGLGLDTSVPHPARVYAYWLGGKDNYAADRKAADEVIRLRPEVVASARANRAFLGRVVRYLAGEAGIRQFLDIGTGLPAPDNTHQVAQQADPACRVVYVDNDPVVLAHARALLISTPQGSCDYLDADLRDPAAIIAQAGRTLDFTQPVAVLLLAVLHFVNDEEYPARVVAALAGVLAPGSYLAVSHLTADLASDQVTAATAAYNTLAPVPVTPRTHTQVTALRSEE